MRPKVVVFASGSGSGFENLVEASRDGRLDADVAGLVFNVRNCGAVARALRLGVQYAWLPKDIRTARDHQMAVQQLGGEDCYVMLSGCLWNVPMKESPDDPEPGLDPRRVVNIHPAVLSLRKSDGTPRLGGQGMHGDAVHQKAIELKQSGAIHASGLTMHFVTKEFDQGPIIFEYALPIIGDSWEALKKVINPLEHYFQPWVLNHVVHGRVSWDGKNPSSLKFPADYWRPPICE